MIKTDRQLMFTVSQIKGLQRTLDAFGKGATIPGVHPRIYLAQKDALRCVIDELKAEVAAYEARRK